jgi:hypothetical protein
MVTAHPNADRKESLSNLLFVSGRRSLSPKDRRSKYCFTNDRIKDTKYNRFPPELYRGHL